MVVILRGNEEPIAVRTCNRLDLYASAACFFPGSLGLRPPNGGCLPLRLIDTPTAVGFSGNGLTGEPRPMKDVACGVVVSLANHLRFSSLDHIIPEQAYLIQRRAAIPGLG